MATAPVQDLNGTVSAWTKTGDEIFIGGYFTNVAGQESYHLASLQSVSTGSVSNENEVGEIPNKLALLQNYPNPFNPTTQITFTLPQSSLVRLEVFDMIGRKVATLIDEVIPSGINTVPFNANGLSSGTYIYRINTGNLIITKKMMLIK